MVLNDHKQCKFILMVMANVLISYLINGWPAKSVFRFFAVLFMTIALLAMFIYYKGDEYDFTSVAQSWRSSSNKTAAVRKISFMPKLIVPGSTWFGLAMPNWDYQFKNCSKQCRYSDDLTLLSEADAILFHYWGGEVSLFKATVHQRTAHQRFIIYSQESPLVLRSSFAANYTETKSNFYNWTMSYRMNDIARFPYGRIAPVSEVDETTSTKEMAELRRVIDGKNKTAIWISSHCHVPSKRELVVQILQSVENITVDIWGACKDKDACPKNDGTKCEQRVESEYFFLLAFENSVCKDYVTEKFWQRVKQFRIVPVVLNRQIAEQVGIPAEAFIAVDDFPSIAQLGAFLLRLQNNTEEYEKYFHWRRKSTAELDVSFAFCDLCDRLWDPNEPSSTVADPMAFFMNNSDCVIEPKWI